MTVKDFYRQIFAWCEIQQCELMTPPQYSNNHSSADEWSHSWRLGLFAIVARWGYKIPKELETTRLPHAIALAKKFELKDFNLIHEIVKEVKEHLVARNSHK